MEILFSAKILSQVWKEPSILSLNTFPNGFTLRFRIVQGYFLLYLPLARFWVQHMTAAIKLQLIIFLHSHSFQCYFCKPSALPENCLRCSPTNTTPLSWNSTVNFGFAPPNSKYFMRFLSHRNSPYKFRPLLTYCFISVHIIIWAKAQIFSAFSAASSQLVYANSVALKKALSQSSFFKANADFSMLSDKHSYSAL